MFSNMDMEPTSIIRLPLFVCALLVLEYILAWAIQQYLSAQKIVHENEGELGTLQYVSIPLTHH